MELIILDIKDKCTGCGACVSACTKQALTLEYDNEGFYYPIIDSDKCIKCHLCEKVCHTLFELKSKELAKDYNAYMAKAHDKEIVKKSSSGGVFSLLAEEILKEDGVVYGARYNYDTEQLEHCSTDNCTLDELRKSKYVESYLGKTFLDIKKQLQVGRKILFCGTPCQVKGLQHYLKSLRINTDNLITVRFICHGVPANKFLTEYKHWKENIVGSKITHMDFRPKTRGWRTSNIVMKFENGKVIDEVYKENYYYYYYYFQKNLTLRRSCYNCSLIEKSFSDYTIADFWGIVFYEPKNNEQEGISLVLTHNDKAEALLKSLDCDIEKLPQESVEYIYRDAKSKSAIFKERESVMKEILQIGYMKHAIKTLRKEIIIFKTKARIRCILNKLGLWKIIKR